MTWMDGQEQGQPQTDRQKARRRRWICVVRPAREPACAFSAHARLLHCGGDAGDSRDWPPRRAERRLRHGSGTQLGRGRGRRRRVHCRAPWRVGEVRVAPWAEAAAATRARRGGPLNEAEASVRVLDVREVR
ncbi:hypothetical protein VFPBJ_09127 [Purpureocillium lilacinum]|uniref:Uncharacterized protein n=1 Tax=Purpureocillium lilacinum TaxID=33203 RepID=A0A179GBF6_PURLI|nr:hypothetical protein VFPBJ_09127 [Purpureocillium lilacinum]